MTLHLKVPIYGPGISSSRRRDSSEPWRSKGCECERRLGSGACDVRRYQDASKTLKAEFCVHFRLDNALSMDNCPYVDRMSDHGTKFRPLQDVHGSRVQIGFA